mmetsp:Transcript_3878/g.5765  ORF Transcript_3878/g.5765 Transcript_3878/m.5765 type:complete len:102 (+) Transcript_3878:62-367(+)
MNNAVNNIPEHQKAEFMQHLETQQAKDSMRMYNHLVAQCFDICVKPSGNLFGGEKSFASRHLDKKEEPCVNSCAEKFIKLTQRVGLRFAEYQSMQPPPGSS